MGGILVKRGTSQHVCSQEKEGICPPAPLNHNTCSGLLWIEGPGSLVNLNYASRHETFAPSFLAQPKITFARFKFNFYHTQACVVKEKFDHQVCYQCDW